MHKSEGAIYEVMRDYIHWGLALFIGFVLVLVSKDKLMTVYTSDMYAGVLSSILMVISAGWFCRYLYAGRHELDLLDRIFLAQKLSATRGAVLPVIVLIAVASAVLIGYSTDLLVYSAVSCVLCFADLWGVTTASRTLNALMSENDYDPSHVAQAKVLQEYYVERPHTLRIGARMLALITALVLAIIQQLQGFTHLKYIIYGLLILAPISTEAFVVRWRYDRDVKLATIRKEDVSTRLP